MATKKTTRRNSSTKPNRKTSLVGSVKKYDSTIESLVPESSSTPAKPMPKILFAIPIIIALLALLLWRNKGLILVATVNNQPVWRWDLEQRFVSRFGTQTLEEMVNEQILKNEASKQGITVTEADLNNKTSEIEKTLEGKVTLKDALKQQGMTMEDFNRQLEVQIMIEKLTAKKVTVTDKDISDFIEQNKENMMAKDEAGMKAEAKAAVLQSKQDQEFQKIFADLKKNAKVTKYL